MMSRFDMDEADTTTTLPLELRLGSGSGRPSLRRGRDEKRTSSFTPDSGLSLAQADGTFPKTLLAAKAPGDCGISLIKCRFERGLHVWGTSTLHMLFLALRIDGRVACRVAEKALHHVAPRGNLTVCPAGAHCVADGDGACEGLILLVPRDTLSFAFAERSRPGAGLVERLRGEDPVLLGLGIQLARQVSEGFVDGPLAWSELTNAVVTRLGDAHASVRSAPGRGLVDAPALGRVIDFIHANIDRPFGVDDLADVAQQSRSHFPRMFRRSVGISPYQYVTKVRLTQALALIQTQGPSLAQIAVRTGFADQSHLCRWMRRAYGASPTRLATRVS